MEETSSGPKAYDAGFIPTKKSRSGGPAPQTQISPQARPEGWDRESGVTDNVSQVASKNRTPASSFRRVNVHKNATATECHPVAEIRVDGKVHSICQMLLLRTMKHTTASRF